MTRTRVRESEPVDAGRRRTLRGIAGAPVAIGMAGGVTGLASMAAQAAAVRPNPALPPALPPAPPRGVGLDVLARDEAHWARVGDFYARTEGIVNLEHGYWGRMSQPVLHAYESALERVNTENSWYARRLYGDDYERTRERVARLLDVDMDEVAITRNATEAIHNLIRQYRTLGPGDAVLLADVDYPSYKRLMNSLGPDRGVRVVTLQLPSRADQDEIFDAYAGAFEANPDLKLALVTHASNQHGLLLPIARIAAAARARGIDVVCDAAQSLGLVDFSVRDLDVDWAGFNLHKWIGAPLGLGALYMRRGSLDAIAPYPGEADGAVPDVQRRVHTGTWDFAAAITVPDAIDFHDRVGAAAKEARLRYLRSVWTDALADRQGLEILGGRDEASWTGMASFRLPGRVSRDDARALQQRLEQDFGIFTVIRVGLASGACVRVTPQVYTARAEIEALVSALREITA